MTKKLSVKEVDREIEREIQILGLIETTTLEKDNVCASLKVYV